MIKRVYHDLDNIERKTNSNHLLGVRGKKKEKFEISWGEKNRQAEREGERERERRRKKET